MNQKFKKVLKTTGKVATGFVAFAGTLFGAYVLTPNRTNFIDVSIKEAEKTPFEKFVEKLTRDVGLSEDEEETSVPEKEANYLSARFENFKVQYSVENSSYVNNISVEGGVDLRISDLSLNGIELNVDAVANYNGQVLPITLGHFNNTLYFGLKDMKLKITDFSEENIIDNMWYTFAMNAHLDFAQLYKGLDQLLTEKVFALVDGLLNKQEAPKPESTESNEESGSSFDISKLLAEGPKESFANNSWTFTLGEEGSDLCIKLVADDDYTLKKVDLGTITFGNITISGAINIELKPYDEFVSPASDPEYVEMFNYTGLISKLATLVAEDQNKQRLGFEFALDLDNKYTVKDEETDQDVNKVVDIAHVKGSINVDFDELLDLSQYTKHPEGFVPASALKRNNEDTTLYDTIKKVGFNLQLDLIGQNNVEYANLALVFADGEGFLRFNEQEVLGQKKSVMKLNVPTETMNWIVAKVPELLTGLSGDENNDTLDTLKSFLSDEVVEAIDNGDYSFILEMIETLENDAEGIRLGLDISSLGIGENARIDLSILDAVDANTLNINVTDLAFGNFELDASLKSTEFSSVDLGNKTDYQSIQFLPDVVDQVSNLAQTKKTGFRIYGDMKNSEGLGISFDGRGQLDNNDLVKEGYGTMTINEYKYHGNKMWAQHLLAVDVTNLAENVSSVIDPETGKTIKQNNNLARFIYGDPSSDNVKGKMKLQSFVDIFDIVKTFIGDFGSDPKYNKFLAPITKLLGMSAIGDIIESRDYLHFASNELLKEISVINNGGAIRIVIAKDLIGLPNDIELTINFNGNNETGNQTLKSLVINNLALSDKNDAKKLNLTFELQDYDDSYANVVSMTNDYMDLDGIKTLLDLGINTTKLNFYHLSADLNVDSNVGITVPINGINFYIYVDGVHVKVYGTIDKIKILPVFTTDCVIEGDKVMSCEFGFQTYDNDTDNKVGGTFDIKRKLTDPSSELVWEGWLPTRKYYDDVTTYHYRTDSANFMDNIAKYLVKGVMGLSDTAYNLFKLDEIGNSSSSDEKPAGNFTNTFTSTGFKATVSGSGLSTKNTIKLGLNLNELTGIDVLKQLEATITSKRITYEGNTKGIDILSSLNASLHIEIVKVVSIDVSFTASVEEAQLTKADALNSWNNKGQSGLSGLQAVNISNSYFNNPDNPYKTTAKIYK